MGGQKMQLPFILAIFKAFMEDGKDIADYDVLAEITEEAGVMSKDQVRSFFYSCGYEEQSSDLSPSIFCRL